MATLDYLSDLGSGLTIYGGLQRGGAVGDTAAAIGATKLAANATGNTQLASGAGIAGNALGIYTGLEEGGVVGYGGAAVNAAKLGSSLGAFGSASSDVAAAAGVLGAGLSIYNFATNWQSGATGADALSGAEAGASIGSIVPGVGTIIGGVIGGAVGAISSIFGSGETDPETNNWQSFINATGGANATQAQVTAATQGMAPATAFNLLTGVMDIKDGRIPITNAFGVRGETTLLNGMTTEINSAIKAGKVAANATPQQIYSQVVQPWLNSKGATITPETGGLQLQGVLQSLIGSWQSGQLTSKTALDSGGSTDTGLPAFAGGAVTSTPVAKASTAATTAALTTNVPSALSTTPSTGAAAASALPLLLAMPGGSGATQPSTSGAASVADPNNPGAANPAATSTNVSSDPTSSASTASLGTDLSSLGSDLTSFLSSPLGNITEFGTLAGVGLAEASSQKSENDALASSLSASGAPYTAAGAAELSQLEGGPQVSGPLGASIAQQTSAASELGQTAETYGTGNLTAAQNDQVNQYVADQEAAAKSELANSGITDPNSSQYQAKMQQIQDNAAILTQQLVQQNTSTAAGALTAVQSTYSNLLNGALSSSEFGFSTTEAAVQTQIQSDTALAGQIQQLLAGIAQGFGASTGSKTSSAGAGLGSAIGSAVNAASGSSGSVGLTSDQENQESEDVAAAGGEATSAESSNIESEFNQEIGEQNAADESAWQASSPFSSSSASSALPEYSDYTSDPFG